MKMTSLLDVLAQLKRPQIGFKGCKAKIGSFWLTKDKFLARWQIQSPKQSKTHTGTPLSIIFVNNSLWGCPSKI